MHPCQNQHSGLTQPLKMIQTAEQGALTSVEWGTGHAHAETIRRGRETRFEKGKKMAHSNGRWRVPDESGKGDDPDKDFPIREAFTDYSGQARQFVISYFRANLGFGVQAEEEGKGGEGYFFREFDPNSPYLALGRIRGQIRTALATRHIEQQAPGNFQATHQTVRGRISYGDGEVGFVIDGQFISLQQFGKMVETFEGWEFRLDILD